MSWSARFIAVAVAAAVAMALLRSRKHGEVRPMGSTPAAVQGEDLAPTVPELAVVSRRTSAAGTPLALERQEPPTLADDDGVVRPEFTPYRASRSLDSYARDPEFNPNHVVLSAEQVAALEELLQKRQMEAFQLHKSRFEQGKLWARSKIARGLYDTQQDRLAGRALGHPDLVAGKMLIVMGQSGSPAQIVTIAFGEYAPLDDCERQLQQHFADTKSLVMGFFSQ